MKPDVARVTERADGRSSRWDAHRATRRRELLDVAIAVISEHGPDAGMGAIAAAAGTSKAVIYRYFADKHELHRAVSARVVEHVVAALRTAAADRPAPRDMIRAGVAAYLGLLEAHPALFRFVTRPGAPGGEIAGQPAFGSEVAAVLGEQLAAYLDERRLDPQLAHPWGEAIVGFIASASLWWLDNPDRMTRAQLGEYLATLLWSGAAGVYEYDPNPAR